MNQRFVIIHHEQPWRKIPANTEGIEDGFANS